MSLQVYLYSFSFTSLFSFCLAFFVLYKNRQSKVSRIWALACLCCSGWSFFSVLTYRSTNYEAAVLYSKILNVIAAYMCVLVAHFCKEVVESKKSDNFIKTGYVAAVLITCFAFLTDQFVDAAPFLKFNYFPLPKPLYHIFTAHFFIYFMYGEYQLIKGLSHPEPPKRNQIKYILTALTCGYIGGIATFLTAYRVPIEPVLANFVWLYAAIISYAILKHQLLDIKVVLKRTIFYSLLTFAISLFYVLLVFIVHQALAGPKDVAAINLYLLPPSIGTIVFFVLGFLVLFNKPASKEKVLFSVLCFETFFWQIVWLCSFLYPPAALYDSLSKIAYVTITFIPATFYHLIAVYTKKKNEGKFILFFYLIAFVFETLIFSTNLFIAGDRKFDWGYFVLPGPIHPLFAGFAILSMIRGLALLIGFIRTETDSTLRNRTKYLFLATGLYFLCNLDFFQVYGATWYPIGSLFFLSSCIVIALAISKHNLLDIRIVIRKAVIYSVFTVSLSLIYLLFVFLLYSVFLKNTDKASFAANFLGILFLAITFKPIEIFCHRFLERRFFRGTIGEISEQKERLESQLERRERLKSVGILAAGMAHEIKNPLTSIQTFAEYLPEKYDDPQFREKFSKLMIKEVERIKDIVQNLLTFSKPKEPTPSLCVLGQILKEITDFMSSDLLRAGITVAYSGERAEAYADRDQLKQAFLNILTNAVDAMRGRMNGRISIYTSQSDGWALATIQDTGEGISADKLTHIFDPFFTGKEDGTGLGLAVTYSIVEKNRGQISVSSLPGTGTAFTLKFPVK